MITFFSFFNMNKLFDSVTNIYPKNTCTKSSTEEKRKRRVGRINTKWKEAMESAGQGAHNGKKKKKVEIQLYRE